MKRQSLSILKKVGIFSLLTSEELSQLSKHLAPLELEEGQVLFHEGEPGNELYVIATGGVAVNIRLPDGSLREIARLAAGDFFGDMSIFDNAPRSASCTATTPSRLLSLSKDAFSDLIAESPAMAMRLMYRMLHVTTQRLKGTSELVSDMVQWGESARKRAITDELTGVYNRRFLEDSLGPSVAEARQKGEPLSLAMSDLDRFRQINEAYGHQKGDAAIREVAQVLRACLRPTDVIARYGGDEFVILLPNTRSAEAVGLLEDACKRLAQSDLLKDMKGPITSITGSFGVAGCPEHAQDLAGLRVAADAALYRAKDEGRNRVCCAPAATEGASASASAPAPSAPAPSAPSPAPTAAAVADSSDGAKHAIVSIRKKNRTIEHIIEAIVDRRQFLILGHQNPDDDCISSMISFALVLRLFYKEVRLYLGSQIHERFHYLLAICRYNSIPILGPEDPVPPDLDTAVLVDTPKPSMVEASAAVRDALERPGVIRIEIDHHLAADSRYWGDEGYRLVTEASSASELVGHILLKLEGRKDLLERHQVTDLYPRNVVLAILTGIIGDSNMGQYLKSRREKKYYQIFSSMFNELLSRRTTKKTNFSTMDQVFTELQKLSTSEEECYRYLMARKRVVGSIGVVAMDDREMAPLYASTDPDTIVSSARVITDRLAEESGKLGMVAYYDNPEHSDLVQFRIRRAGGWKRYDLRNLLETFSIANGGGHEGAIGFRIPRAEIKDFRSYVADLMAGIERVIPKD